jgi:hypothetical protein
MREMTARRMAKRRPFPAEQGEAGHSRPPEGRPAVMAWLLPLSYALHLLEEWFGGFRDWIAMFAGSPLPATAFIVINAIAMVLMIAATWASTTRTGYSWAGIAVATVLVVNALAHAFGTLVTSSYSPGLVTALLLYLPLAGLVLLRASSRADRAAFRTGVVTGFAIHALVFLVAFLSTR